MEEDEKKIEASEEAEKKQKEKREEYEEKVEDEKEKAEKAEEANEEKQNEAEEKVEDEKEKAEKAEEANEEKQNEAEEKIEKRKQELKEKISSWLKNPYNLAFLSILFFALIIRLYYFLLTKNQPLWWDEAEYMSTAKSWALGIDYNIVPSRTPFLPFLAYIIMQLGGRELAVKFLIELAASFGIVIVSFFIAKEMYNKKTALITAFLMAVFWLGLFNTYRVHTDIPAMFLSYLTVYFFWKGYIKKSSKSFLILMGIFSALAILMKPTAGLVLITLALFLLITRHFSFLKEKNLWLALFAFLLMFSPYFIYAGLKYSNPIIFLKGSHVFETPGTVTSLPLGWNVLSYPLWFTEWPFFIIFILAIITVLIQLFIRADLILTGKDRKNPAFFLVIWILIFLFYFIFVERQRPEDRWVMPMILPMFIISSHFLITAYSKLKRYSKGFAVIALAFLLIFGAYYQLKHADLSIKGKKDSYMPVREAALWMKENSNEEDTIMSVSYTQTVYYSERKVYSYPEKMTQEEFESFILEKKPKYLVVSVFEVHHPKWMYQMPEKYFQILQPVKIYQMNNQPVLIVYEFKGYELSEQITQPIQSITTNQTTNQTINRSE